MKKIVVIAAMEKEADLLKELACANLIIAQSGIGKVAAAVKTAEIIAQHNPDLIINSGIAGGLDSSLNIGDMVCGATVCYHDVCCGAPSLHGQVQGFPLYYQGEQSVLKLLDASVKQGLIVSGDQFVSDKAALMEIKQNFPQALAVDMESAAIAQTCYIHQIPFLSLRLLSDTPGVEHHQQQYDDFWHKAPEISFQKLKAILNKIILMDAN